MRERRRREFNSLVLAAALEDWRAESAGECCARALMARTSGSTGPARHGWRGCGVPVVVVRRDGEDEWRWSERLRVQRVSARRPLEARPVRSEPAAVGG